MPIDEERAHRRIGFLQSSTCTPVHVDRHRRDLVRGWCELLREHADLARQKAAWFHPYGSKARWGERLFCFVPRRMKWKWRKADRHSDTTGRPADVTVGSTDARKRWFELLRRAIDRDQIVRVRHRYRDEPALLVSEEHYRSLERAADDDPLRGLLGDAGRSGSRRRSTDPPPEPA